MRSHPKDQTVNALLTIGEGTSPHA